MYKLLRNLFYAIAFYDIIFILLNKLAAQTPSKSVRFLIYALLMFICSLYICIYILAVANFIFQIFVVIRMSSLFYALLCFALQLELNF